MDGVRDCPRCGNPGAGERCRHCGEIFAAEDPPREFRYRQINIKEGQPFVDAALRRLSGGLEAARAQGVRVLSVVHGYGASGKGGAIRDECRKSLDVLRTNGQIADFIRGEDLGRCRPRGKNLLRRFPQLDNYRDCQVGNPGITVVIL